MKRLVLSMIAVIAMAIVWSCAASQQGSKRGKTVMCPKHITSFSFTTGPSGKLESSDVSGYVHAAYDMGNGLWSVGKFKLPGYRGQYPFDPGLQLQNYGTFPSKQDAETRLLEVCDELQKK